MVAGDRFKINGSDTISSSLKVIGDCVPEVGKIISSLGAAIEFKNEYEIK